MEQFFSTVGSALYPVTICLLVMWLISKCITHYFKLRFQLAIFTMIGCLALSWVLPLVPNFFSETSVAKMKLEPANKDVVKITAVNKVNEQQLPKYFSLLFLWMLVSVFMMFRFIISAVYTTFFWCKKQPLVDEERQRQFQSLCKEFNIKRRVSLRSSKTSTPGTFGILRPVVIVPEFLLANFSQKQLRPILTHELMHVCRYDQLVVFLEKIFIAIYFFHPLAWWIVKETEQTMEICCDQQVLTYEQNGIEYAKSFMCFLELKSIFCSSPTFTINYFAHVKERINLLVNAPEYTTSPVRYIGIVICVFSLWCSCLCFWGSGEYYFKRIGHAAMHISSYDTDDPVEVGGTTIYVIELRNEGTAPCTNVVLTNKIADEMVFVGSVNPVNYSEQGKEIRFAPVKLQPGESIIYKVKLRAQKPGSAKNTAFVKFDEFSSTMRNEEGTSVYPN
ncbi:M56 family metallopeptidase [Candidatus Uabimicrobium sp. HlEnr_7]|uniref:M56 family metallopeptidase n=1 Tax=Candidatus Uabimicrobium helgolandensis TaxID=3095367 RepID=UPI003558BE83